MLKPLSSLMLSLLLFTSASAQTGTKERLTEHFQIFYDPQKLTEAQLDEAEREAEASFKEVAALFPQFKYADRIALRLDARFRGATGYAAPGGISGRSKRDAIGLRYEDLKTLGLTPAFLFRHELTHLFSAHWRAGQTDRLLGGSTLNEGLADLVAGGRNRLGLPLSFSRYLKEKKAWADPLEVLLTRPRGGPPRPQNGKLEYERVLRWRIEHYVQPSLFLAYVQSRIGWEKMRGFYVDYTLASQSRTPGDDLRVVFRRHLGKLPEEFMEEWDAAIAKAQEEVPADRQRWLSERAYSAVQWYDFHIQGKMLPESALPALDRQFQEVHAEIAARRLDAAETKLESVIQAVNAALLPAPRSFPGRGEG